MNAPSSLSKIERLRARDGDACWLCNRTLDFIAVPNSKKAPTVEHLVAKSLGGSDAIDNLVLCHPGCNLHLADRSLEEKKKLRAKWHANTAKVLAASAKAQAKPPIAKPPVAPAVVSPRPMVLASALRSDKPAEVRTRVADEVAYWRRLALIGAGGVLLSFGFAAGLSAGLLLS